MNSLLYIDCFSGISGDMMLGGLLDLGRPEFTLNILKKELKKIGFSGYEIETMDLKINSIHALKFNVAVEGNQPHRNFKTIKNLIDSSGLNAGTKKTTIAIFSEIARAEAKVHEKPVDNIHFHEVGAIDSIIDIAGTAIAFDRLKVDGTFCSRVPLGSGFAHTMHGIIPVPAPATVEILKGLPVYGGDFNFEATTPTGAAIIKVLVKKFGGIPEMEIIASGYGAGFRALNRVSEKYKKKRHGPETALPDVLRLILGRVNEEAESNSSFPETEKLFVLSTNIDNTTPEICSYASDKLFQAGALDVWMEPVFMKKNRTSFKLNVLCRQDRKKELMKIVFTETDTLGIRIEEVSRVALERQIRTVKLPYGQAEVKTGFLDGIAITSSPEYESCRALAEKTGKPLKNIYRDITYYLQGE